MALGLALGIQAFLVKPFRIPSQSMEPTLDVKQRVLVDRVNYRFGQPDRGDIVVFKPPKGADSGSEQCGVRHSQRSACPKGTPQHSDTNFIKRIVAVGGDHLKVINNRVYIDGKRQRESFVKRRTECSSLCNLPREITVPKGYFFMMGDNRGESEDSRAWGPVPKKWLIGKAFATYWPPGRIGLL